MADNISFISTKSGQHSKQKRLRAHVDYDEMTVKYGRISLGVPCGFKACLENVTREVLREQPKDIPAFLACYFHQLNENQKKGISANNLVTERIVEIKAFEEQGVQKEEERIETQDAGNVTDDCQVSNVQSQTEVQPVEPAPVSDENVLSFEQQQEIEHEGEEANQEVAESEVENVTEEVKAVCLEDILKKEEYKQEETGLSLEEQEKIEHEEQAEEEAETKAEEQQEQETQSPKPVCLEQLLKEKEQSQILEENSNPKKIESAPSTNQKSESENDTSAKVTQSEPAVFGTNASEVPSHISLDALPDNIKLVEAIVTTSVTELAEEAASDSQEVEKQEEEQVEQVKAEENTTEQKVENSVEETVEEKNGDVEA